MRCPACKQYVPDGLGLKTCPSCNADITNIVVPTKVPPPESVSIPTEKEDLPPKAKTVSVKARFVVFYSFLIANIAVVLWEYVIKTGSHFKMDAFVARLEYRGSLQIIELLSPLLFWLLAFSIIPVAYVLKREKAIKKSEVFLVILHVFLSPLYYGFGQLCVPLFLMMRSDPLKLKNYITSVSGSAFTSPALILLPLFGFLIYVHSLSVAMTPSKGYALFNGISTLGLFMFFPDYCLKLFSALLISLFFSLRYFSIKYIAAGVFSLVIFLSAIFLHFEALPIYKKISYKKVAAHFDKQDTATIIEGYSGYHALGKEIALDYIRKSRLDEAIQMIKGKEKLSDEMLYGLFVILKESNRIDTITYWFDHLKNAIERRNFAAIRLGVDVLNKVGTDEAKKILIELEGYAKSDPNFDFSLKLLEENRLGKSGELKKDSTLSKSKPADAPVEPVTKQEDEPNFISVNGKVIPNPKKQK